MTKYWKRILLFVPLVAAGAFLFHASGRLITFDVVRNNRVLLNAFVRKHYLLSLLALAAAFLSTAFCLPGALVLTIASGFLFGAGLGALYSCLFLTAGSVLAFLASRHLLGDALQRRYGPQLERFNSEILRHGRNYLFVLRVLPVMPAFLLNYLCGLTRMPVARFASVTFFGMLPGALVYSFAGGQLAAMESTRDILSPKMLVGIGLLAALALVPVAAARLRPRTGDRGPNEKKPRPVSGASFR